MTHPTVSKGPALVLLLLLGLAGLAGGAAPATAQEIRLSGNQGFPGIDEIGNPRGLGFGLRYFLSSGLGIGLERDLYRSHQVVERFVCEPSAPGCMPEPVAFDSELDFTTLMLLLEIGISDSWAFRFGIGRSAGRITGEGEGQDSGDALVPAQADLGASTLAWSRGADGTVFLAEVLRPLPIPGPISFNLMASYRNHSSEMSGCEEGRFSPFCGRLGMSELQLGILIGVGR